MATSSALLTMRSIEDNLDGVCLEFIDSLVSLPVYITIPTILCKTCMQGICSMKQLLLMDAYGKKDKICMFYHAASFNQDKYTCQDISHSTHIIILKAYIPFRTY